MDIEKPYKVLLSCPGGANDLWRELRHILERSTELELQLTESASGLNPNELISEASAVDPDLIFLNLEAGHVDRTVAVLQALCAHFGDTPVIAVTEAMPEPDLYSFLRLGAADFLVAPIRSTEVLPRVRRLLDGVGSRDAAVRALKERLGLKQIVGESRVLLAEIEKLPVMARSDGTVLISGETGTGKEVFARSLHYLSPRSGQPLVAVNCGAIPVDLLENELFGHESGAFTGAAASQPGVVQEAEGGTLFLDEVDSLTLPAQVKLLRFLQEKEYRPLGARRARRGDVRVIAASSSALEEVVRAGRFRQDLYYRLNVLPVRLPPLRERREDIPLLARFFVERYATEHKRIPPTITPGAMQKLLMYAWPGNVRELENVVQRAVLLSQSSAIQRADFQMPDSATDSGERSFQALKYRAVAEFERSYLQAALLQHNGNISAAARSSRKDRRAFWELLRKHHLLQRATE